MQKELAFPFVIHDGQGYTYTSSSAFEDTPSSDAQKWIQDFQNSQAGQAALTELASDKQLARIIQRLNIQKDFPRFQELLLLECYWAHQYQATGDHIWGVISKEWRRQNDANAELAKVVGRASERIETLYHANPWHVSEYVKPAYEKIIGPLPKEQHTERLIDLLNALREALENDQGRAASAHRYGIGCLAYDRAVKDRNRPKNEVRTGLEFSIALRFKQFTRTNHPYRLDIFGLGWPRDGKPHYDLVARFSKATLGGGHYRNPATLKNAADKIGTRLTKLRGDYPDLRYVGWPIRI